MPGAPNGGLVAMRLDGTITELFVPYEDADLMGNETTTAACNWYGLFMKKYRVLK